AAHVTESPRLDEAVTKFKEWLDRSTFRDRTKDNLRLRIDVFVRSVPNVRVADITADQGYGYLAQRNVSTGSKGNDRRVISRFFAWAIERPQQWIKVNPARKETRERKQHNGHAPAILSLDECSKLMSAAKRHRKGRLVPYFAVCLIGGLRPFEASRVT